MNEMIKAKKILVLGGPGSGKSVLSANLSRQMSIPAYHLDEIHLKYDETSNGKKHRNNDILKILKTDYWILDGNYRSTLAERTKECDVIFLLDYSFLQLITSVFVRSIKQYFQHKKHVYDIKMFDLSLIKLVYKWKQKKRNDILNVIKQSNKKVYIFKNRKQLNNWFKNEFNNKLRSCEYE